MRKRPLLQSDLWLSTVRGVCWGWSPSASPGNIGHSPGRFPMRSCLEPHTMGIPQPFAVSLLSSSLPSVHLSRGREVSVTLLAHGCVMPIWGIPADLPQGDPVGQCLQHLVVSSHPMCRSEHKDFSSSHGSPSLGLLPDVWGQRRWQIVARAATQVTRYSSLALLVTGDELRDWTSCTRPMAKSLPHPQGGAGSGAAVHNETGVGPQFMIGDILGKSAVSIGWEHWRNWGYELTACALSRGCPASRGERCRTPRDAADQGSAGRT